MKYPKFEEGPNIFNRYRMLQNQHLLDMNIRLVVGNLKFYSLFKGHIISLIHSPAELAKLCVFHNYTNARTSFTIFFNVF